MGVRAGGRYRHEREEYAWVLFTKSRDQLNREAGEGGLSRISIRSRDLQNLTQSYFCKLEERERERERWTITTDPFY